MRRLFAHLSRKKTWMYGALGTFILVALFVVVASLPPIVRQEKVFTLLPSKAFEKDDARAYFESTLSDLGLVAGTIYGSIHISPDERYLVANAENNLTGAETFYFDFETGTAESVMQDYFFGVPSFSDALIAFPYNGLFLEDLQTKDKHTIEENSVLPERPMFSPDGTMLLYSTKNGPVLYEVATGEKKTLSTFVGDRPLYWYDTSGAFIFSRTHDDISYKLFSYKIADGAIKELGITFVGKPIQLRMDANRRSGFLVSADTASRYYTYIDIEKTRAVSVGKEDIYERGTIDYFQETIMKREDCFVLLYDRDGESTASFILPHADTDTCPYAVLIGSKEVMYEVRDTDGASRMYRYEDGKSETLLFERASTDPEFLFGLSPDRTLLALSRSDHFVFYSL